MPPKGVEGIKNEENSDQTDLGLHYLPVGPVFQNWENCVIFSSAVKVA